MTKSNILELEEINTLREKLYKVSDKAVVDLFVSEVANIINSYPEDAFGEHFTAQNLTDKAFSEFDEAAEKISKLKSKLKVLGATVQFSPNLDYKYRVVIEVSFFENSMLLGKDLDNAWNVDLDLDIPRVTTGRPVIVVYGQIARAGVNYNNIRKVFKYMSNNNFANAITALRFAIDQSLVIRSSYGVKEMHTYLNKHHKLKLSELYRATYDELIDRVKTLSTLNTLFNLEIEVDSRGSVYYDDKYLMDGYTNILKEFTEFKMHYSEILNDQYISKVANSISTKSQYSEFIYGNISNIAEVSASDLVQSLHAVSILSDDLSNQSDKILAYIDYIINNNLIRIIKTKKISYSNQFSVSIIPKVSSAVENLGKQ
jgi:molybdopterin converting factor small subunit